MKRKAALAVVLAALSWQARARAEIKLGEAEGWEVSTDGRVNAFISTAFGTGIPEGQQDFPGTGTKDTHNTKNELRATRIRNGFLQSILGFTVDKQVNENLKVTARAALWMNISGMRMKGLPGGIDPRELYGKLEGPWGSLLGGSNLALFGRGGILTDAVVHHEFGLGYPCMVENAGGGACGMAAFGAIFPGFEPGFVYTTPSLGGFELALGVFDPANVANGELNRSPLPRLEAEASFAVPDLLKVFGSAFWQKMEGSPAEQGMLVDIEATGYGAQAGLMFEVGPVMAGGAGFIGQAIAPFTYLEESPTPFDEKGVPRKSRGGFGVAAFTVESINLKLAGGAGIFRLDKSPNDPLPNDPVLGLQNPKVLKQNFGISAGVYQTTGPVHFALEYFRAEHTFHEAGMQDPANQGVGIIKSPTQTVNFINAGFTIAW
jgi:hypothetical protein